VSPRVQVEKRGQIVTQKGEWGTTGQTREKPVVVRELAGLQPSGSPGMGVLDGIWAAWGDRALRERSLPCHPNKL
jgi:hypothetical protein